MYLCCFGLNCHNFTFHKLKLIKSIIEPTKPITWMRITRSIRSIKTSSKENKMTTTTFNTLYVTFARSNIFLIIMSTFFWENNIPVWNKHTFWVMLHAVYLPMLAVKDLQTFAVEIKVLCTMCFIALIFRARFSKSAGIKLNNENTMNKTKDHVRRPRSQKRFAVTC